MTFLYIALGICGLWLIFNLLTSWYFGKIIYTTPKSFAPTKEKVYNELQNLMQLNVDYYDSWEKEELSVKNGEHTIRGEYHSISNARGIAIVVHGFGQNRYIMIPQAKILRDMGFSTILYDQRRFGISEAPHGGFGVAEGKDAACMVDYVRSRFGKDTKIVMIGCSMGAISVLNSQLHTEPVDAIIEDSSPDHVIDVLPHFYSTLIKLPNPFLKPVIASVSRKVGYDIRKNNPVDAAAQIKCPVCVMHGEADRTVPVEMGHNIYKALKNPLRRIETFPGRDHCYEIMDTERYTKIVNEFVEAALSK